MHLFLALVFGTTWLFQLPWLLAERGVLADPADRFMPLVVLGFFAPCLIALVLAAREGRPGMHALWRPLAHVRVHPGYYLLALTLPPAIFLVARAFAAAVSGSDLGPWIYPPAAPQQLAALLVIPFTEQLPWRGYLYPRLERARGPLLASSITGFAWGLFHVQKHAFLDSQASLALAALTIAFMTSGTFVFTWFYRRSRGSLLLVVVAHMGAYLNNPTAALPNLVPLAIHTSGYCVVALGLVVFDREVWRTATPELPLRAELVSEQ